MLLKVIVGILLIASLILIFADGAVAQYGNGDNECRGICDQLRDGSCHDPVADCGDNCIPIGDEHKHRNGRNR